jgi:pantoate--beta-alanine ligase
MRVADTIAEVRAFVRSARNDGKSIGLVPTMGALHEGHAALMRRARADEDIVIVSLFVNPLQFGPNEDFDSYPRDFESDARLAQAEGVDLIFAPPVDEMYPRENLTTVSVARLTEGLCGAYRPGHFNGVTTVCAKLFNIVQPNRAYFGEKDYQQLQVIRRMVADLNFPIGIVGIPTVREPDGLALSSRNRYLTPEERRAAPALYRALQAGAEAVRSGATGPQAEVVVAEALATEPLFTLQYVSAVHPETLEPATWAGPPMVIAAAAFLGRARLIDNIKVESPHAAHHAEI